MPKCSNYRTPPSSYPGWQHSDRSYRLLACRSCTIWESWRRLWFLPGGPFFGIRPWGRIDLNYKGFFANQIIFMGSIVIYSYIGFNILMRLSTRWIVSISRGSDLWFCSWFRIRGFRSWARQSSSVQQFWNLRLRGNRTWYLSVFHEASWTQSHCSAFYSPN